MRAALEVDPFAGGAVRDHDANDRIRIESGNGRASGFTSNAAMNHDDRSRFPYPRRDLLLQVFEGVLRFGEDDDLPPEPSRSIQHQRFIEDRLEFAPLCVLSREL